MKEIDSASLTLQRSEHITENLVDIQTSKSVQVQGEERGRKQKKTYSKIIQAIGEDGKGEEQNGSALDSNSATTRKVAGDIVVNPALGRLDGGVDAPEHNVGDANGDIDVGTGESLEQDRVCIQQPDLGNAVGPQELHHDGRGQRVR